MSQTHQEVRSTNVVRINDEVKNRFSQSAKSMIATAQNNMIIHVHPGSSDVNSAMSHSQQPQPPPPPPLDNMNNINFNNALFKKNITAPTMNPHYQQQQQQQKQQLLMQQNENNTVIDPLEHSASLTFNDAFLSDDLAQLQVVDDKSLVNALCMKFEMKKYYVTIRKESALFHLMTYSFLYVFIIEFYW